MRIWRYGDNVNTDMLFPGKYTYTCSTPEEIKPHLLEDLDPSFSKNVKSGDIILAGENFGCGSSREQPVVGFKAVGIQAIVAKSFARIFYRSAINQGLVLIECPQAVDSYRDGDEITLNLEKGMLILGGETFSFPRLPQTILEIRKAGGLLPYTFKKIKKKG